MGVLGQLLRGRAVREMLGESPEGITCPRATTWFIAFISHSDIYVSFTDSYLCARYGAESLTVPLGLGHPTLNHPLRPREVRQLPRSHGREGRLEPKPEPRPPSTQSQDLKCYTTSLRGFLSSEIEEDAMAGGVGRPRSHAQHPRTSPRPMPALGRKRCFLQRLPRE